MLGQQKQMSVSTFRVVKKIFVVMIFVGDVW